VEVPGSALATEITDGGVIPVVRSTLAAMGGQPGPATESDFERFYRRRWHDAVRWAAALTGSISSGEDVAQDAFARLAGRYAALSNPEGYLRTTIVSVARDQHRSTQRRSHRELRLVTQAELAAREPAIPDSQLLRSLARLPYEQRAALVLRYWADWDEAAIAEALACRGATVRSHIKRALDALRDTIDTDLEWRS
jgi:RNA polymerase sigma factor (sigma-70 family)